MKRWQLAAGAVLLVVVLNHFVPMVLVWFGIKDHNIDEYLIDVGFIAFIFFGEIYLKIFDSTKDETVQLVRDELQKAQASLDRLVISAHIRAIPRKDLYSTLADLADKIDGRALNCWFNVRPPTRAKAESREQYFKNLLARAKMKPEIELRRLVLGTQENFPWIQELTEQYRGLPHVSLAVYCDKPLPLSVQVFDFGSGVIVNPDRNGEYDLQIADREAVSILSYYYDALWNGSIEILARGNIRSDKFTEVKNHVLSRSKN